MTDLIRLAAAHFDADDRHRLSGVITFEAADPGGSYSSADVPAGWAGVTIRRATPGRVAVTLTRASRHGGPPDGFAFPPRPAAA